VGSVKSEGRVDERRPLVDAGPVELRSSISYSE
jgi:hypothetical protein